MSVDFKPYHLTLVRILARCPLILLHLVGAAAGTLAFLLRGRSRRQAVAFARQANIPNAWWVVLQSYADFGRTVFEAPWIWLNPPEQTLAKFTVELDPKLQSALLQPIPAPQLSAKKSCGTGGCGTPIVFSLKTNAPPPLKPMVFLGFHLGCSEATIVFLKRYFDCRILYQQQKNPFVHAIRHARHEAHGASLASMDLSGIRELVRHLREGGRVGISADQTPLEGAGAWLPFFGKPAYTMLLAPKLSLMPGVQCVHTLHVRRWGRFTLKLTLMDHLPDTPLARAERFNRIIEGSIRQFPTQYRWAYDRYRFRKKSN